MVRQPHVFVLIVAFASMAPLQASIEEGQKFCRVQTFSENPDHVTCINLIKRTESQLVVQYLNYTGSSIIYSRTATFAKKKELEKDVYYLWSESRKNYTGLIYLRDGRAIVDNLYSTSTEVLEKRGVYYACYRPPNCPKCPIEELLR